MLGLGLGVSTGGYIKSQPLPSKVLYERDGNFTFFDTFNFSVTGGNCSIAFVTTTFAGSSNFLKVTSTATGSDGIFHLDKDALDGNLDDYYAVAAEGGTFQLTLEYGFPSDNTDTGTVSRARIWIGAQNRATTGPAKNTIATLVYDRILATEASDPSGDDDYIKFEFEDPTANEPVSGDVMYIKKIKFEYIAA